MKTLSLKETAAVKRGCKHGMTGHKHGTYKKIAYLKAPQQSGQLVYWMPGERTFLSEIYKTI